jgi:HKD family nuclease
MNSFTKTVLGCQRDESGVQPLLALITDEITSNKYSRISACAAYASYRGVVLVRTALSSAGIPKFRWLLGLDDCITDPQAIKVAWGTHNAETRVVAKVSGRRFHAKAYLLDRSPNESASLIVGSANLTGAALTRNCEGYVLVRAETKEEVTSLQTYWDLFWRMGEPLTQELVSQYEEKYSRGRFHAPEIEEESSDAVRTSKTVRLAKESLHSSRLAWIELGFNTGGGGQLDIVKKLSTFLGLPTKYGEGTTVYLVFNSPQGERRFQVTFTKGMWRFMNLQQGFRQRLRPDLTKPSPYVLVISREEKGEAASLSLQRVGSKVIKQMIEESRKNGFVDSSVSGPSGRLFGWY